MNILIKFPTRGRPEKFFDVMNRYAAGIKVRGATKFLVTLDSDDPSMNNTAVISQLLTYKDLYYDFGTSVSKIHACNRGLNNYLEARGSNTDIILLASDDMIPQERGYDEIIRAEMRKHYPDTDGCLWFNDGYRKDFCTLSIVGRKYYDRFEYLYHPSYKSFYCDNEFTEVAQAAGKIKFIDKVIIKHLHPDWIASDPNAYRMQETLFGGIQQGLHDATFMKNSPYVMTDKMNYEKRKAEGYPET